jgi:hypothetical protein
VGGTITRGVTTYHSVRSHGLCDGDRLVAADQGVGFRRGRHARRHPERRRVHHDLAHHDDGADNTATGQGDGTASRDSDADVVAGGAGLRLIGMAARERSSCPATDVLSVSGPAIDSGPRGHARYGLDGVRPFIGVAEGAGAHLSERGEFRRGVVRAATKHAGLVMVHHHDRPPRDVLSHRDDGRFAPA